MFLHNTSGWVIGGLEILLYLFTSILFKVCFQRLHNINKLCYFWLCMTILTGIWEATYLTNYDEAVNISSNLISKNEHVWTNEYTVDYVFPWKLAKIFYGEYGAWADREYMSMKDPWSHTVEGTHAVFCAFLSFLGMCLRLDRRTFKSLIVVAIAMSSQLMNSILYMAEYYVQCSDVNSVNYYNNSDFPLGTLMFKRPFMYVNAFWMLCPAYILMYEVFYSTYNTQQDNNKVNEIKMNKMDKEKSRDKMNKMDKMDEEDSREVGMEENDELHRVRSVSPPPYFDF